MDPGFRRDGDAINSLSPRCQGASRRHSQLTGLTSPYEPPLSTVDQEPEALVEMPRQREIVP